MTYAPNEIVWRFEHEDENHNRHVVVDMRNVCHLANHRRGFVEDFIKDWARKGSWEDEDLLKVVVVWPEQLAATYYCSIWKEAIVSVEETKF